MALIVQECSGSSVADTELIKRVAKRVAETEEEGNKAAVVVSAMGDTTDGLIDQALSVDSNPPEREMDMLMTAGERISMSLLVMAIRAEGDHAHPFTGQQAGFSTDAHYGTAHIKVVRPDRVKGALSLGDITIVAGFQGISAKGDTTTPGRDGSDISAVTLAVALGADICKICTDVGGTFTADPRIVPSTRHIPSIDYESILEVASCGSKVLTLRCMKYAQCSNMSLYARSSFSRRPGTLVVPGDIDLRALPNLG